MFLPNLASAPPPAGTAVRLRSAASRRTSPTAALVPARIAAGHRRTSRQRLDLAALPLLARICLVVLFPFSALDKIVHWKHALKQADSSIVPNAIGPAMLVAGVAVESITPVCILLGRRDRVAAVALAGFCTVTALLFHPFWQYPDFWSPSEKEGNSHFWDFLKNFGLVGGLLLVAIRRDFAVAPRLVEHPLTSSAGANPVSVRLGRGRSGRAGSPWAHNRGT